METRRDYTIIVALRAMESLPANNRVLAGQAQRCSFEDRGSRHIGGTDTGGRKPPQRLNTLSADAKSAFFFPLPIAFACRWSSKGQ